MVKVFLQSITGGKDDVELYWEKIYSGEVVSVCFCVHQIIVNNSRTDSLKGLVSYKM